jgi:hypothetical protein
MLSGMGNDAGWVLLRLPRGVWPRRRRSLRLAITLAHIYVAWQLTAFGHVRRALQIWSDAMAAHGMTVKLRAAQSMCCSVSKHHRRVLSYINPTCRPRLLLLCRGAQHAPHAPPSPPCVRHQGMGVRCVLRKIQCHLVKAVAQPTQQWATQERNASTDEVRFATHMNLTGKDTVIASM